MKISYFLLFFISLPLLAQSGPTVRMDIGHAGQMLNVKCSLESSNLKVNSYHYDLYLCSKKGKQFFVRKIYEFNNYSGFTYDDEKKEFEEIAINEITQDKETVYKSVFIADDASGMKPSGTDLYSRYNGLESFKQDYSELFGMDTIPSTKEIRNLQLELKLAMNEKLNEIKEIYKNNQKLTVTTKDGKTLSCERGKKSDESCLQYLCSGIGFQMSLRSSTLSSGAESPYLVGFNQDGLAPDLEIDEIKIGTELFYKNDFPPSYQDETRFMFEDLKKSAATYNLLTDPVAQIYRQKEIEACHDEEFEKFEKGLQEEVEKATERLQQTKLVQVVENVNGILQSRAILASEISSNMCYMGGDVYYYDKENYNADIEKKLYGLSPIAKVVPKKRLNEIYNFAVAQKDIPYAYYQDGCFARAHILCYRMEEQLGIDTEKIWARGPVSPPNDDKLSWTYHVATKINVEEEDGKIQGYVIDPSVANRPLLESEWLSLISTDKKTAQMKTTWPPILDTGAAKNIKVSYSPNEIYAFYERFLPLPEEILEKDRQDALRTNEMYRSYLNEDK